MSDEVKVGDRFEWIYNGDRGLIATVTSVGDLGCTWTLKRGEVNAGGGCVGERDYLTGIAGLWWRRLPREAPSIEERRAALKPGDTITDPALLVKGMRVRLKMDAAAVGVGQDARITGTELTDTGAYPVAWERPNMCSTGIHTTWFTDGAVTFLGWAQEEKAVERPLCEGPTEGNMSNLLPAPPPTALPFKRHPDCKSHHAERNCLDCEELILVSTRKLDEARPKPQRPEPHQPSTSLLGGVCGPILARLK